MKKETTPPEGVKWHEFANVFPMLQGEALDGLRRDIAENGVREAVVFLGNAILDGRNRYMCARELGIEYPRREFGSQEGDGTDPLAFVISHNLTRRHLSESQRAQAGTRLANMQRGGDTVSEHSANLRKGQVSTADAARMLNVSPRSIETARSVQSKAPEISPLVDDGSISVSLASKVAELPEDARAEIVDTPASERKEKAKAFVQHNSGNNEWYTPPAFLDAAHIRGIAEAMRPSEAVEYLLGVIEEVPLLSTERHPTDDWPTTKARKRLAKVLYDAAPKVVSHDALYAAYTIGCVDANDLPNNQVVSAQICHLRKKLPDGVKIETVFGEGYRMVRPS